MYVTMKKTLALCAAAFSTLWWPPAEAAAVGFLGRGSRRLASQVHFADSDVQPALNANALFSGAAGDAVAASVMTTPNPYMAAFPMTTMPMAMAMAATTGNPLGTTQYQGFTGNAGVLFGPTPYPPGMFGPGGLPERRVIGGEAIPREGEDVMETTPLPGMNLSVPVLPEFPISPTPLPPCNWTHDWEGVARPADCELMPDGNHTCVRSENTTFILDPEKIDAGNVTCIPPKVQSCNVSKEMLPLDGGSTLYAIEGLDGDGIEHGHEFYITCGANATPIDHELPLESWGQDWYPGIKKAAVVCNNGTLMRLEKKNATEEQYWPANPKWVPAMPESMVPRGLNCQLKKKVDLTQDLISYLRWTEPRMAEAETRGYKWIDMDALFHKMMLKNAMANSSKIEMAARQSAELNPIPYIQQCIDRLITYRMVPRGEEYNQDTCKDLEKHWLYQVKNTDPFKKANNIGYANYVPPVNKTMGFPSSNEELGLETAIKFQCSYTLQKSGAGYDPYTGKMNWHYRDGCYCESNWINGCPFRAELAPNFKTFGFDTLEIKSVSHTMGVPTNALCWYFSAPANPEWGYLRTDKGYAFQAPYQNVTELKKEWIDLRKKAQDARFKKSKSAEPLPPTR